MTTFSTPFSKFALLPTLLAVSLAMTACQKEPVSTDSMAENNAAESDSEMTTENNATVEEAMPASVEPSDAVNTTLTPEEQLAETLTRYRWTLVSAHDDDSKPIAELMNIKDQVMLNFNQHQGQNTLSYSVGCNTMSASYVLKGLKLIPEDGMSTKMSCQELDKAEESLIDMMEEDSQLSLVNGDVPMLTQVTDDADILVWKGRMTSQAKYNSKGETLFWSVDAKTKPCANNPAQQCFQVKPITYNEQGVKVSEGKVGDFAGTIEGYQPDGKHNEVLRLQRYQLDKGNNALSEDEYAYVLDAVIESAVAN